MRRPNPHYSREFVTKPSRRQARRARGTAKEGSILEQYVDRLSGEPARRQACRSGVSAVAVEVFVNNAAILHHQILATLNSDRTAHNCQAVESEPCNFIDFLWEVHISRRCSLNQTKAQNLPSLHQNDCKIAGIGSATAHGARHTLQEMALRLGTCAQSCCMVAPLNNILGMHRTPGPLHRTTCHQEPDCGVSG
jgi:hypothetical protein